jgi:hypothetical protein
MPSPRPRGQVVARGPRGAVLESVPAPLRDSDAVRQLRELRDWLASHERECLATVEGWMVRSLPVPSRVLYAVWPDPAWQRQADPDRGVGVITLDGESVFYTRH